MVPDESPRHGCPKSEIAHSMELTHRWAGRSRDAFHERPGYGIFGIVQGNIFEDLREESAKGLTGTALMDTPLAVSPLVNLRMRCS